MKLSIVILLVWSLSMLSYSGFSQDDGEQFVEISGTKYLLHTVRKNETSFGICQKYQISQAELQKANPGLSAVLQTGAIVKIPRGKAELKPQISEKAVQQQSVPDEEYYYHKVVKNQNLGTIARQYGISESDVILYNPQAYSSLTPGTVLKIPVKTTKNTAQSELAGFRESETKPGNNPNLVHFVVSGETLYGLERQYGVSHEEITALNPELAGGLKTGMKLKLPVKAKEQSISSASDFQDFGKMKYKAGLLLPLYLSGNEHSGNEVVDKARLLDKINFINQSLDTVSAINGTNNIDQKSIGFLEFYEGALLALDSMQRQGMDIEFYVFDVSNQEMVNTLLQLDKFRELNLIIGPVFPELQEKVAEFAARQNIPMVSPLAPTGSFEQKNPAYIKVNPGKDYQMAKTADYIGSEFRNSHFFLIQFDEASNSAEAKLGEKIKGELSGSHFHQYNYKTQGVQDIKALLSDTENNVFYIPTDNEAQLSIVITNLTSLAENYNIVLMGTPLLTKFKSLQTESFHRTRLRYLTPYYVDYNKPLVKRVLGWYRDIYFNEPTQFSFQ